MRQCFACKSPCLELKFSVRCEYVQRFFPLIFEVDFFLRRFGRISTHTVADWTGEKSRCCDSQHAD